ncbi:hypothetical protein CWO85_02595 [Candidatus Phytoplasma ziziphi]|uniref:Uncharacterized protein n=1 Tax=Ziziphus jujuba witches'-broom phytoplasma TaxID=135727 RepID=A0A660HMW4_ZIZJU|nr:hypothetical protein CWO85_02595 [Candidatus Phytoplasma ziziphi]
MIHKMYKLTQMSQNRKLLEKWRQKNIFFIIDECHRTQSGSMHNTLKNTFPEARFFGFTGTPLFKDHILKNEKSTEELFGGDYKHSYTMYNALKETTNCKCILPFCIRYLPKKYKDLDSKVQYILDNHNDISQNRKYNAILIAQDIKHLLKYYELFQKKLKEDPNLHSFKIAAIFSNNIDLKENSNQEQSISEKQLDKIIKEYDPSSDIKNYHQIILKDMKENKINILIVVRMFLTGFDSPLLNALYVDRPLQKHELFQAFSRTIRKDNDRFKPYGNIYCFQTTKEDVDDSLKIFASNGHNDKDNIIVKKSYTEAKEEYNRTSEDFRQFAPDPQTVNQEIIGYSKKENEYLKKFNDLKKKRKNLKTYQPEFNKDVKNNNFHINEEDFFNYQSKYRKIKDGKHQKINTSSSTTFEEKKEKFRKFIEDLRQITPKPEDVYDLKNENKDIFIKLVNVIDNQLEIMRPKPSFNINEFSLSEEELKLYQQKRDQLEEEEKEREFIIDLDYLDNLDNLYNLFNNVFKLRDTLKLSESSYKKDVNDKSQILFKIEEQISLCNFTSNQKKLLQKYFSSDSFFDYFQSIKQESNNKLIKHYYNFIEKTQESELKEKANELGLPLEELKDIIEYQQFGADESSIRRYIHKILGNKTIDAYRKNNLQLLNIPKYKLKMKLKDLIYDFIKHFIKKYYSERKINRL